MSQRRIQILVLCEDRQQEVFARHFLKIRGFNGTIRFLPCPDGSQSAEQYVRLCYPKEVKAYRSKVSYLSIGLVVVIDADKKTVDERLKQLDDALIEDSQQIRQPDEAIEYSCQKEILKLGYIIYEERLLMKKQNIQNFLKMSQLANHL
ncbi:hypothetical protein [Nostoc flagelliforme]|uniref:hypothetical protein n=1 Tax=Nostoc flagelliforme TaxID=1306274 RepID=UPI001CEC4FCB|nr:hypothetical protein [Nostoc flagelliforme]